MRSHSLSSCRPCPYCDGFLSSASHSAAWDTELAGSNSAVAIVPTRGSLLPGWLLVVPRVHVLNSRLVPSQLQAAFEDALRLARQHVEAAFGPATLFEHGPMQPGTVVGCGVDHVHMHVVALPFDLVAAARAHPAGRGLTWVRTGLNESQDGYLWVRTPDGEEWQATGSIPSQFFRRVIAGALDMPSRFDWRTEANPAALQETLSRIPALAQIEVSRLAS